MDQKRIKLIFIRHGESEKNTLHIKSRAINKYPLTHQGIQQVKELADELSDKIDLIISSPVLRCKQSAEILNQKFKTKLVFDDLISEYNSGEWDEVSREELLKMKSYQDYCKIKSDKGKRFNYRMGKTGETRAEIVHRAAKFIAKIRQEYSGKTILIVSHGGLNAAMAKALNNISLDEFFKKENIGYDTLDIFYI